MSFDDSVFLGDILDALDVLSESDAEFKNEWFTRVRGNTHVSSLDVKAVRDDLGQRGIRHYHLSVSAEDVTSVQLPSDSSNIGFRIGYQEESQLWLPRKPVRRCFDDHGRIESEHEVDIEQGVGTTRMVVRPSLGTIELPALVIPADARQLFDALIKPDPIERIPVSKRYWFDYDSVVSVWDYVIRGTVYDPRTGGTGHRWQCQQCAHTLWYYLDYLQLETGKELYRLLRDLIAYSVLLSLPEDGRWRHGTWTNDCETHTRFQVDGIHLLVSHFRRQNEPAFLDAARRATDYLVDIADKLHDEGIWFLHDSLESPASNHYDSFESTAFGKSESTTLCLNTHVWTLTALYRVNAETTDDAYETHFNAGLRSLRTVLDADSGTRYYEATYGLRDLSLNLVSSSKYLLAVQHRLDNVVRDAIRSLKKRKPRLLMPNGYIERDLTYSELSDYYHMQNLKDLLVLYGLSDADWIYRYIEDSLRYTFDSGLAAYFVNSDDEPDTVLDVLALAMDTDDTYAELFSEYLDRFQELEQPWAVDPLASPLVPQTISTESLLDRTT